MCGRVLFFVTNCFTDYLNFLTGAFPLLLLLRVLLFVEVLLLLLVLAGSKLLEEEVEFSFRYVLEFVLLFEVLKTLLIVLATFVPGVARGFSKVLTGPLRITG